MKVNTGSITKMEKQVRLSVILIEVNKRNRKLIYAESEIEKSVNLKFSKDVASISLLIIWRYCFFKSMVHTFEIKV